ncbi:hypothetical protein AB0L05_06035 [Nonomuraea pusilla]|uniref:hypothetical protein n=1 Tax=Nonomuraea pusilla TaxID=46177 RepID=UPI00332768E4
MRATVLAAVPLAFVLLAGCGSGGDGGADVASAGGGASPAASGAASGPTPGGDPYERNLKYAQCMRENGVDVPDPERGKGLMMRFGKETSPEKVQKAQEACKQYAPSGMTGGKADPQRAEAMRRLAQCMRDNGVEAFPDPEGGAVRITPEVGDDPDFKAAQDKCHKEFSDAGPGGA